MRMGWSWLDVRLGVRMLVKYPGLSLVGGAAIAFAVLVGAVFFELLTQALHPELPLPRGAEVVGVRTWDSARQDPEPRVLQDFLDWRQSVASVQELSAFRGVERNLLLEGEAATPVTVAEMTASGFRAAAVAPLLGRTLVDGDEAPGAPPVAVIGHGLWQERFAADPGVLGRTVQIGSDAHTIVGVMPPGFAFPVAHELWTALALPRSADYRTGPSLTVFGRLAPGAGLEQAQAEFAAIGQRASLQFPDTHAQLRPEVLPYAESILPLQLDLTLLAGAWSLNAALLLFVALIFANVGMLVFARTASREGELVVRNALGASRRRIVSQLFVETLVLAALATLVGTGLAQLGIAHALGTFEAQLGSRLPFWFRPELSPRTIAYAGCLALLAAAISGVLPALKATGKGLGARLQQRSAGSGGLRFGGVWSAVIIAQVAVTFAFPLTVYLTWRDVGRIQSQESGMAASEFLVARVEMDRYTGAGTHTDPARIRRARAALEQALEQDPAVRAVTYGTQLPRMYHPWRRITLDAPAGADGGAEVQHRVAGTYVAPDFFDTMGASLLAGRGFAESDLASGDAVVVVNEPFVQNVLGGGNAIGRRIRYEASDEPWRASASGDAPWYRIIGVVPQLGVGEGTEPGSGAGLYHPLTPQASTATDSLGDVSTHMAVHVRGDPSAFAPRLQAIAAATEPDLRLYAIQPMEDIPLGALQAIRFWAELLVMASLVALTLSLAGIYAVTSFTVVRRRREVGIRMALGARPWRVIQAMLAHPLRRIAFGLLAGMVLGGVMMLGVEGGLRNLSAAGVAGFAGYGLVMAAVCLLACLVPVRRALRVQPTEALRDDG